MLERLILRAFLVFGFVCLPFTFRKPPVKDWLIVFFAVGFISKLISKILMKHDMFVFPIRFFPKYFKTHLLYENLMFPLFCVWFNQTTFNAKKAGVIGQAFLYSGIHTIIEYMMERKTNLIEWKQWTWMHNFSSLTLAFLASRGMLAVFRWLSNKYD